MTRTRRPQNDGARAGCTCGAGAPMRRSSARDWIADVSIEDKPAAGVINRFFGS